MKTSLILCLFIAGIGFLCPPPLAASEKDTLNPYDVRFVKSAGQSSLNEVKIAELGTQKAQNSEVKLLASTLVKDHNAALAEVKTLAEKKGVSLSASIDTDTAEAFKALEKESGIDFDKALVKHMDDSHIKSIKSYEEAKKEAKERLRKGLLV